MNNSSNDTRRFARYAETVLPKDASGWQTFKYGKLGEVTDVFRTFVLPYENGPYTFNMKFVYDSWNRIDSMFYPDGEVVVYGYNSGGMLSSMTGAKNGLPYKYIESIRYNEFELKAAMYYGNGTKTIYRYDTLQRLSNLYSQTSANEPMQDIVYTYDSVSNIINITNYASTLLNGLGGKYGNTYQYDNLYRLVYSAGTWYGIHPMGYELDMEYTPNGRIVKKYLEADTYTQTPTSSNQFPVIYQNDYHYDDNSQPNTLIYIDNSANQYFKWDVKGNMMWHFNTQTNTDRYLCWDEQNRLLGVKDNMQRLSYYQYDANGDRVYKLTGDPVRQNRNGEWRYSYLMNRPTLYASPYVVTNPQGYTKHYYAESERVASRIGGGGLLEIDMNDNQELLASHKERSIKLFAEVMECLGAQAVVETSPLQFLYSWKQVVYPETDCYWYHPDHLGSSSWITFSDGKAVEHLHYMPWGEDFVRQRSTNWYARFTFSAKEKDQETGFSYFGSRYYSSDLSIWLSVDPMSDKYPSLSPYVYCADNPIKLVDPNGEDIWEIDENGKLTWKEYNSEIDVLHATKTKQSKDFPVGTIKEMIQDKGLVNYNGEDIQVDYQYLDINNDDLASCFFEFVSENTEIEWSLTQTGENDNRIAHDIQYTDVNGNKLDLELSNGCGSVLLQRYIKNNVPVRSSKHSHPYIEGRNIVADPSGYDKGLKQWFVNEYKERANIKYEVYGKKEDAWKYMPY